MPSIAIDVAKDFQSTSERVKILFQRPGSSRVTLGDCPPDMLARKDSLVPQAFDLSIDELA